MCTYNNDNIKKKRRRMGLVCTYNNDNIKRKKRRRMGLVCTYNNDNIYKKRRRMGLVCTYNNDDYIIIVLITNLLLVMASASLVV